MLPSSSPYRTIFFVAGQSGTSDLCGTPTEEKRVTINLGTEVDGFIRVPTNLGTEMKPTEVYGFCGNPTEDIRVPANLATGVEDGRVYVWRKPG